MKIRRIRHLSAALLLCAGVRAAAETLTLKEAHATALRNHPQVAIAQLQELVAQEVVKENRAAYFPTASAFVDAVAAGNRNTRILAGGLNNPVIYDRVADGLGVNQLITDFGQTSNRVASAKLSAKARTANSAATDQQILLNVDITYFSALQNQAVLRVAQDTLKARQLLVDQVTALQKNQLRSELDVSFAEVGLEQSRLILQKAVGDAEGAQAGLSAALGYRDGRHFELADDTSAPGEIADADSLIATAMNSRPDLQRFRYEQSAADSYARAQKDENYPTVAAVGTIGNAMSHDDRLPNRYAAGGIAVDIPLFEGGEYVARQHEAELKARIAEQALRDQEDNVSRDVRVAWLNYNSAVQQFRTTEQLLKHANQAYALAEARYRIGSSSIVELTDAQVNATSAQIADANARYGEFIQRAILDYQTGVLR